MPIEMLSGFTANISMETQIQQNRRYTTIQLDIIHTGDCLEILKTLPDDSVHCCVTSPPYYALRDYGMEAQIGRETTPKEYISRLTEAVSYTHLDVYKRQDVYNGRLPVHVRCLLDEFANIGQIPKFDKLIATIRSREISASIILQSQSQLKTIYKRCV